MSILKRLAIGAGGLAAGLALVGTTTSIAQAEPIPVQPIHAQVISNSVTPQADRCGYVGTGWGEYSRYNNCVNWGVNIAVEHMFSGDTYQCVPAHWDVPLGNSSDYWDVDYAYATGRGNC